MKAPSLISNRTHNGLARHVANCYVLDLERFAELLARFGSVAAVIADRGPFVPLANRFAWKGFKLDALNGYAADRRVTIDWRQVECAARFLIRQHLESKAGAHLTPVLLAIRQHEKATDDAASLAAHLAANNSEASVRLVQALTADESDRAEFLISEVRAHRAS